MKDLGFNEYKELAMRTCKKFDREEDAITNVGLGLAGECGEVADIIKKHLVGAKQIDKEHLKEELGDVLWYLAEACYVFNIEFLDVAKSNIKKLMERFPNGFDGYGKR